MAIQEVPWFQACVELTCLQCESLLDTPGVKMERKVRLHSTRDGYVVIEFKCPSCGWTPSAITSCLDATARPSAQPILIEPTAEEIESINTPPPPPKKTKIIMPDRPLIPVEELFAHAEKKFPPRIKLNKSDVTLERKVTKFEKQDGDGISVVYTDGKGSTLRDGEISKPNPFHVERTLFCAPDLPDNQEMVDWVMEKIRANNQWTNPNPRRAPAQPPKLNAGRSRLRVMCSECGDTSGDCGCPGMIKNMRIPTNMQAHTNILQAPDGSAVESLGQHIDSIVALNSKFVRPSQ